MNQTWRARNRQRKSRHPFEYQLLIPSPPPLAKGPGVTSTLIDAYEIIGTAVKPCRYLRGRLVFAPDWYLGHHQHLNNLPRNPGRRPSCKLSRMIGHYIPPSPCYYVSQWGGPSLLFRSIHVTMQTYGLSSQTVRLTARCSNLFSCPPQCGGCDKHPPLGESQRDINMQTSEREFWIMVFVFLIAVLLVMGSLVLLI
jgi:hypothetical protein